MNCERAEQLLPLHAGGDLAEGRARVELTAHLVQCDACRRAAEEWAEHLSLLRREEPPEFDAAFFDSIRRDVMREIKTGDQATPALSALLAQLLRPRVLAYAASLALVCAVALLFALRLARAPQPSGLAGDGVAPSLSKQALFNNKKNQVTDNAVAQDSPRAKSRTTDAPGGKHRDATRPTRHARESATAKTPHAVAVPSPGLPDANAELAASVVKDEREMLKIDLQTSDPDVRIIWFSPQPSEQTSPRRTNDRR